MAKEVELTNEQIEKFREDGFLVFPKLIEDTVVDKLKSRISPLFHGQFETGVYPDEWYWREGMSFDDITREMCNAWKCDRTIASVVTSSYLGKLASQLMGWPGAKVAQDDIFWKPVSGKEIFYHQDQPYFNFMNPSEVITIWIALTPANTENGTIEYARGSHKWPIQSGMTQEFHAPKKDYRDSVNSAARHAGKENFEIVPIDVLAGGISFHRGETWHGSGKNPSSSKERISLVIHMIRSDAEFQPSGVGYIYGRYKLFGSTKMEETFFPIVYTQDGYRSPVLKEYCTDALV